MENINNMGQRSLEELSRENLTEKGKRRLGGEIIRGAVTLACLFAGLIYTYLLGNSYPTVPQLLYFAGVLIEGVPVIYTGLKGVFSKNFTNAMEILVAIAIVACVFNRDLIVALLIPLILNVAHLLEERSIMGGRDVIEGLKNMQQSTAWLLRDGKEERVDAKSLKRGNLIVVKPGDGIPVDGAVVEGTSDIDQKSLTGEPQPVSVGVGDGVYAGTVNLSGRIVVCVEKEFVDTSFSKILKLLEKSEGISAPESRMMDRFFGYYIPFVLLVAALVALITKDISKAIAVLVVSCPCGQMLVSSAPMIAALSVATKRGVLIKNSKFIEELSEIDTVVFDKTGTVTEGELSFGKALPAGGVSEEELIRVGALLASASNHPVSRALTEYAAEHFAPLERKMHMSEVPGGGVEAKDDGGATYRFGRREWIEACGCRVPSDMAENECGSVSFVEADGVLLGGIVFTDTVRREAKPAVEALVELGVERTVMLTGDRAASAHATCEAVGIDEVHAELMPADKLAHLRGLGGEEHGVLAVGDGINDALALREADVGIAMGAMGSDLAIESADIALMNNNLMNVPFVIELSQKTRRIIYQNLVLSILISVTMIALSALGVISAIAGSVLHNFGAFAVLINSSRILKGKSEY